MDASVAVPAACSTLFNYLSDCSASEMNECAREYATVGQQSRTAIDSYAQCAANNQKGGCSTGAGRWGHGPCQTQQGSANAAVPSDPLLASLRCIVSADTSNGNVLPNGCHRSDGTSFGCASPQSGDYGRCCLTGGEVACFFSSFTALNLHFY